MPNHIVQENECLDSIAAKYGMPREKIWQHVANNTIRLLRKDGRVLKKGDSMFIPDKHIGVERCATEMLHRFRRLGVPVTFRLQLLDHSKPRSKIRYRLLVDGIEYLGKTDSNGWIEVKIQPDAQKGKLSLYEEGEEHELNFGRLDPVEDNFGQQQRLQNLGFYNGETDGEIGAKTKRAITHFEVLSGIDTNGNMDEQRKAMLLRQTRS